MKKELAAKSGDQLRPEYDLSQLKGGVRGKYYRQANAGTNLVLIEPDLAKIFPDSMFSEPCTPCGGRSGAGDCSNQAARSGALNYLQRR